MTVVRSNKQTAAATATAKAGAARWVGFDMDECLGSFMPIWPFCEVLPNEANLGPEDKRAWLRRLAETLASRRELWLFRPGLDLLLDMLRSAKERKAIAGCFILTNNGSWEIAEVVRHILNIRSGDAGLFVAAWHRYTPCRRKTGSILTKDLTTVQACLRTSGLPTLHRASDLLFYDDYADHVLADEIPHYTTVSAYTHYTPIALVYKELKPAIDRFGFPRAVVQEVLTQAEKYEDRDLKTDKTLRVYSPPASMDAAEFTEALGRFLSTPVLTAARKQPNGTATRLTRRTGTTTQGRTAKTARRRRLSKN